MKIPFFITDLQGFTRIKDLNEPRFINHDFLRNFTISPFKPSGYTKPSFIIILYFGEHFTGYGESPKAFHKNRDYPCPNAVGGFFQGTMCQA